MRCSEVSRHPITSHKDSLVTGSSPQSVTYNRLDYVLMLYCKQTIPLEQSCHTGPSRFSQVACHHAQCQSKPVVAPIVSLECSHRHLRTTLWVILGPLAASDACAKKTKVTVRIKSTEMTSLWKVAIVLIFATRGAMGASGVLIFDTSRHHETNKVSLGASRWLIRAYFFPHT